MRIGELAQICNCPVETIRYYEKIGLLPGERAEQRAAHAECRRQFHLYAERRLQWHRHVWLYGERRQRRERAGHGDPHGDPGCVFLEEFRSVGFRDVEILRTFRNARTKNEGVVAAEVRAIK